MKKINLPAGEEEIRALKVGDEVLISGVMITARDAAHKYMTENPAEEVRPFLENSMIYHCGPVVRKVDDKELDKAKRILKEHPSPVWADAERIRVDIKWFYAALTWSRYLAWQREPEFDYEIQVFRIGKTAYVSLPGEPFVEGGLRIKMASPTHPTYIVHCTNQYVGYIPTAEAFKHGGHEVKWSKLVPEALDMIVDAAVEMLNDVFSE